MNKAKVPEIVVFEPDAKSWRFMSEDESSMDVFKAFRKDVQVQDVREETIGEHYKIFYDARAYMDRDTAPTCRSFEWLVRPVAEYAPVFRGPLVVFSRDEFLSCSFAEACGDLWSKPPPVDTSAMPDISDAPQLIQEAFSRLKIEETK